MNASLAPLLLLANALLGASVTAAGGSGTAFPRHTIEDSELRTLPPTGSGRHYQLHVGLPSEYEDEPGKRYPVVYVTDAYWDFAKIFTIRGALVYDRVVPQFIIVGLGYAGDDLDYGLMRRWELSPVSIGENEAAETSGHAAEFLQTIKTEIIPFVEEEYRADPSYRVLAGASLGGLFTLHAMLTEPELFNAYIAATPAVIVGNDWLLGYEDEFSASGKAMDTRLYVTGGGNESPGFLGGILRFNARLASRNYEGLEYEFRIIDGERHAGMQLESYTRGLRFAFRPLAPEAGPSASP